MTPSSARRRGSACASVHRVTFGLGINPANAVQAIQDELAIIEAGLEGLSKKIIVPFLTTN